MSNKEHGSPQAGADASGRDRRAKAKWEMRVLESPNRELFLRLKATPCPLDIRAALDTFKARLVTEQPTEAHVSLLEEIIFQLGQAMLGAFCKGTIEQMAIANAPVEQIGAFLEQWKHESEELALLRAAPTEQRGAENIVPQTQLSFRWVKQAAMTDANQQLRAQVEKLTADLAAERQGHAAAQVKISTLTEENQRLRDEVEQVKAALSHKRHGKAKVEAKLERKSEEAQQLHKDLAAAMALVTSEHQAKVDLHAAVMRLMAETAAILQTQLQPGARPPSP